MSLEERVNDCLLQICERESLYKKYKHIIDKTIPIPESDESKYLKIIYDKLGDIYEYPFSKKNTARDILTKKYSFNSHTFNELSKKRRLDNARIINPPELQKGGMKCKKCGKTNTWFYELQTRSGDEPMTVFILCGNTECKAMYKYT